MLMVIHPWRLHQSNRKDDDLKRRSLEAIGIVEKYITAMHTDGYLIFLRHHTFSLIYVNGSL